MEGVNYIFKNCTEFLKIGLEIKKELLHLLKIEHRFLQAFDLIYISDMVGKKINFDILSQLPAFPP